MATISETIFEQFCSLNGYSCERIVEGTSVTPDYVLHLHNGDLIVEIKQFNPNPDEKKALERLKSGRSTGCSGVPGKRVRQAISSGTQIRSRTKDKYPSLLVLYNNVLIFNHTNPYFVMVGMYGFETYDLLVPHSTNRATRLVDRRFGSSQKMTPQHNTCISAVGVIEERDNNFQLDIYHNVFASITLPISWLQGANIQHFSLSPKPPKALPEWVQIHSGA